MFFFIDFLSNKPDYKIPVRINFDYFGYVGRCHVFMPLFHAYVPTMCNKLQIGYEFKYFLIFIYQDNKGNATHKQ